MKRYRLLKDLPTFKAGDTFHTDEHGSLFLDYTCTKESRHWRTNVMAYHHLTLEKFPNILTDWFEEIKPLIKDEKIRKAIMVWAEANGISSSSKCIVYSLKSGGLFVRRFDEYGNYADIDFWGDFPKELDKHAKYTLEELVGNTDRLE